jgi:hypothetical protein
MIKKIIFALLAIGAGAILMNYLNSDDVVKSQEEDELISQSINDLVEKKDQVVVKQTQLIAKKNRMVITDCDKCENKTELSEETNRVVSAEDVKLINEPESEVDIDKQLQIVDELFRNQSIDQAWAVSTENDINNIFLSNENNPVLLESGLDFTGSECRTSICNVSFVPINTTERVTRVRQMLALTSFFDQNQMLSDAQMYIEYTQDGQLLVKLNFDID